LTRPARLSRVAQREFAQALRNMEHVVAAEQLQRAVADAARRIGRNPSLGSVRPHLPAPYRFWSLTRFGYVLVYDPQTDPVEILRFVHTKRDLPRVLADLWDAPED
jgi:plasmid stabilization system protein ParE